MFQKHGNPIIGGERVRGQEFEFEPRYYIASSINVYAVDSFNM
jgi:hypothetical protein